MQGTIIVMPGSGRFDGAVLHRVAREFGWNVSLAADLFESRHRRIVAVLFLHDALGAQHGWIETTRMLSNAWPDTRLVACHGFTDYVDWPTLNDAGVFHSLWLPLKETEVRKTLGFLWEAENRALAAARAAAHGAGLNRVPTLAA